ncbi:MAG: hypothetical protein OXR72_18510 [Gemmatimonadota bacterium]|nr:hypothetical protein [Gemmatimonadota bacterium]
MPTRDAPTTDTAPLPLFALRKIYVGRQECPLHLQIIDRPIRFP